MAFTFSALRKKPRPDCEKCKRTGSISGQFKITGEGRRKVLIIADYPHKVEDERGAQFAGSAGAPLVAAIKRAGFDLDRDFWKGYAVACYKDDPKKKGKAVRHTKKEIECCKAQLDEFIKENKPEHVIVIGNAGIDYVLCDDRFSEANFQASITTWRGLHIPDFEKGYWIHPVLSPKTVSDEEKDEPLRKLFDRDMSAVLAHITAHPHRPESYEPAKKVEILLDADKICQRIYKIIDERRRSAVDYETSGLKPQNEGHRIFTVAICDKDGAIAFPLHWPKKITPDIYEKPVSENCFWSASDLRDIEEALREYWESDATKIVHNLNFEYRWTRVILAAMPNNARCTMNNQHILDPRERFCGLKFQGFVRYGIIGYDKGVKQYLESSTSNTFNEAFRAPLDRICLYNGIDTVLTFLLDTDQQEHQFRAGKSTENTELVRMADLFTKGCMALADAQLNGIRADTDFFANEEARLTKKLKELDDWIKATPEAAAFKKREKRPLEHGSDRDMRILLFDILGYEATKQTDSGADSVDKESLIAYRTPFTEAVLEYRKYAKIVDTYLAQFKRETSDKGRIHPDFNLHIAKTGRSSSNNPNFQNIPTRAKEAKQSTRMGLCPSKGNKILEVDYGSIEVRIAACYTHDPVLIAYIEDETTDMHRDSAAGLFCCDTSNVSKAVRGVAKNKFVFPEFYGSYWKNCAKGLWDETVEKNEKMVDGTPVEEWLHSKRIRSLSDFEQHVKAYEDQFWKRFKVFKDWQKDVWDFYSRNLHTTSLFGFQVSGHLKRNDVINFPIQGCAFHCLLWSFVHVSEFLRREKLETKLIGQIHDSIIMDLRPEEQAFVLKNVNRIMTQDIRQANPFLIVPLVVEPEITEVDQSWYHKEAMKNWEAA